MRKQSNSSPLPSIGIDLMGSDEDSTAILNSLLPILQNLQHSACFVLFGEEKDSFLVKGLPFVSYRAALDSISTEEDPLIAVRRKKNSSIHLGMRALKNQEIQAFVSMGSTGALIAAARVYLKTLPFISRPVLLTLLPSKNREMALLDVGASATATTRHLVESAAIGIAYQKARGILNPSVGLLNIGREAVKGPLELRKAYQKLSEAYPFFQGNIEGREAFKGIVDVLVTDGFTGNIFLKTSEGIARFFLETLPEQPSFEKLRLRLDYSQYPGALLCGIPGLVIKCHGTANSPSLQESLINAIALCSQNFLPLLQKELSSFFSEENPSKIL